MKKILLSRFLFYLSYVLIVIYYMCGQIKFLYEINHFIYPLVAIILIVLILIQSFKYTLKSLVLMFISIIVFFISYKNSQNSALFMTLLFILTSKNIEIDNFIKFDFKLKLYLFLFVIILYSFGMTNVVLKYRDDGTIRYALGFGHPNVLGAILFSMCSSLSLINYKKKNIKVYLFLFISFLICTFVCDSRASQFGIVILFLLLIIMPKIENNKIFNKIIPFLPAVLLTISYMSAILYTEKSDFIIKLNDLTSTRIKCSSEFLDYYGVNLFGHHFEYYGMWDKRSYLTVLDNSYMNMLLQFGLAPIIVIMSSLFITMKKAIKAHKYAIIICFISLLFYGLMENYAYMIGYNAILIYMSCLIYEKKGKDEDEENSNNNISLIV